MDFPSLLLRGIGAILIIVGFIGVGTGLYTANLVGSYVTQVEPSTVELGMSLTEMSSTLKIKRTDFESSIDDTKTSLADASSGIEKAGSEVSSASTSVGKASKNLSAASSDLSQSAQLETEAGDYLKSASDGLNQWAEKYASSGSPLPEKALFKDALENMTKASAKLKESGAKTNAAAVSIAGTAAGLDETSNSLKSTSDELKNVGEKLEDTGSSINQLKHPISSLISDVILPLDTSTRSLRSITGTASQGKSWAYLFVGYFTLIHAMFIGLGIALLVIDVNLSRSMY